MRKDDVEDNDEDDDPSQGAGLTVIIALMQKNRRVQRKMGVANLTVGFCHLQGQLFIDRKFIFPSPSIFLINFRYRYIYIYINVYLSSQNEIYVPRTVQMCMPLCS